MSEAPRSSAPVAPDPSADLLADLLATAAAWRAADPDPETRTELDALVAAARDGEGAALAARFGGRLAFGTAGLRGELGAGPMRMNRLVVRQAAAGLGRWLPPASTVVIGFDARHKSGVFARDSARVLAAAGHRSFVFEAVCPTPVLAFALRHLDADAGIMCTASHNPARDNGYKVYVGDGAQIIPPIDDEIAAAIDAAAAGPIELAPDDDPAIEVVGSDVVDAYLDHIVGLVPPGPRDVRIVYTPLHGVGGATARAAFGRAGFDDVHVVPSQADPDPDFPTVAFPNPEEPGALDRAAALAAEVGADVVIAHDPDADRLGVMVADPATTGGGGPGPSFTALTGNQIGALLADRVLATTAGDDRLVVTTFVSSHLLARMAAAAGVHYAEVPTGFKWVVRPGLADPTVRFVFGFEEALGYSVDEVVRDKDGISAALRFAELAAVAKAEGATVWDALERLARRFGEHATRTWWVRAEGVDGLRRIEAAMAGLRDQPPDRLGAVPVASVTDLLVGSATSDPPTGPPTGTPPTDALVVALEDGSRVCIRPSGTEPKLKVYVEVVEPVPAGASGWAEARRVGQRRVDQLVAVVADLLGLADP
jgi:phosphomannomutase